MSNSILCIRVSMISSVFAFIYLSKALLYMYNKVMIYVFTLFVLWGIMICSLIYQDIQNAHSFMFRYHWKHPMYLPVFSGTHPYVNFYFFNVHNTYVVSIRTDVYLTEWREEEMSQKNQLDLMEIDKSIQMIHDYGIMTEWNDNILIE